MSYRGIYPIDGDVLVPNFHLFSHLDEKNRITAAGGFVDFGRVNGNLALSRAIGDFEFKKSAELPPEQQIVTAFPDVEEHELTDEDEFLVLACDGKSQARWEWHLYGPKEISIDKVS